VAGGAAKKRCSPRRDEAVDFSPPQTHIRANSGRAIASGRPAAQRCQWSR